ncbi:MAG TPA: PDC sensor domain-containing protein, partial [Burkholderiales bacterium]|nr:PDC sensor domain-containing protein [Burkholderiales bacterium]
MIHSGETLQESIYHQREALMGLLQEPLRRAAESCVSVWNDRDALEVMLLGMLKSIPYGKSLYALDANGIQFSANADEQELRTGDSGRDLSGLCRIVPGFGALLSDAYISENDRLPGLTAIQMVRDSGGNVLGFIGTDFDLHDLPLTGKLYQEPVYWRQLKGDPSIRDTVFHQNRAESDMDRQIEVVLGVVGELMIYHGVYHVMLH